MNMITQEYLDWIKSVLAEREQPKNAYVIEKYNQHGEHLQKFFFYDLMFLDDDSLDQERKQVVWTPQFRQAYLFFSEMEVEEFKALYLTPRKCSIARVPLTSMMDLVRQAMKKPLTP